MPRSASEGFHAETVLRERPRRRPAGVDQLASLVSRLPFESYIARSSEPAGRHRPPLRERPFDVVQLESTLVWPFRFPSESKLVLDEHNIEYENYARTQEIERSPVRRAFYAFEAAKVRRYEQAAWREAAGCVLTSAREEEIVHAQRSGDADCVVPNGVDVDYFQPGTGERGAGARSSSTACSTTGRTSTPRSSWSTRCCRSCAPGIPRPA